jgi:chromosome partitioning protein
MFVVVLASQKGGAGKTTLAAHLGVAAEAAGYGPAVLIDTDPQGTLLKWWQEREAEVPAMAEPGSDLLGKLRELSEGGYRLAFIDTPGRVSLANREVIAAADLVLVPLKPSVADLWTIESTITACRETRRPYAFVVSQATRGASLTVQAVSAASEHGVVVPTVIHNRVGFAAALTDGRTIQELDPKGQGAAEIVSLLDFIHRRMVESGQGSNVGTKQYA